jgi:hypothetical protein
LQQNLNDFKPSSEWHNEYKVKEEINKRIEEGGGEGGRGGERTLRLLFLKDMYELVCILPSTAVSASSNMSEGRSFVFFKKIKNK